MNSSGSRGGQYAKMLALGASAVYGAATLMDSEKRVHAEEGYQTKINKKQKQRLKRVFQRFATQKDPVSDEPLMTPEDFIRSVIQRRKEDEASSKPSPTLRFLFKMADTNETGKINFSEYVLLFKLLTTPESEFEMAFRMFDLNKDNTISKDEFKQVMLRNKDNIKVDFDFDCELMARFFGRDGQTELSYIQFTQFMKQLQEEIRKQEFYMYDKEGKGYISAVEFSELLTKYFVKEELSEKIKRNIEKLKDNYKDVKVSFAEFDAFTRVMSNMNAVATSLRYAAAKDGTITKQNFIKAAKSITGVTLSPLELSIVFKMFSSDETKLNKEDYEEFVNFIQEDQKKRQEILDLWAQDRAAYHEPRALTWYEQLWNGVVKFMLKTLYGGVAGAIGATVVYPIDMVKTRMQNQRLGKAQPGVVVYKSSLDCFNQIIKFEGWKGLYRGLVPQLIGVAPEKAIKLITNDYLREAFGRPGSDEIYLPLEILAGGGAGGSQVVFTNPIEIVKIRLQVQGEIARVTGRAPKGAVEICKELGFSGLYKGASACFARDIPFSAIYFPFYAKFKEILKTPGAKENKASETFLAGTIAGAIAASSTTPLDVIKTRLQVEARAGQDTYSGWWNCAFKVFKKEGPIAFWKGIVPRTLRSSPQFGVTLLAYEALHKVVPPAESKEPSLPSLAVPMGEDDLISLRELYYQKAKAFKKLFGGEK